MRAKKTKRAQKRRLRASIAKIAGLKGKAGVGESSELERFRVRSGRRETRMPA